jgi:hypothetical protein
MTRLRLSFVLLLSAYLAEPAVINRSGAYPDLTYLILNSGQGQDPALFDCECSSLTNVVLGLATEADTMTIMTATSLVWRLRFTLVARRSEITEKLPLSEWLGFWAGMCYSSGYPDKQYAMNGKPD